MIDQGTAAESPRRSVVVGLMVVMFIIAVGYGVVLPILPFSIERLADGRDAAAVSRDTGLLTGTYTLAIFLFAPLWGRLSDRLGRRPLILFGLVGFALTFALFGLVDRLPLLYLTRFLNGFFAAAVTPAAYALVGDLASSHAARAHRFTLLNIAATAGFLVGPMIGGLVLGGARAFAPWLAMAGVPAPFLAMAALALLAAPFVWRVLPKVPHRCNSGAAIDPPNGRRAIRMRLLAIALVTAAAVGAFEVSLSLRGKQDLGLDAYGIGMMFMECSLVMSIAQGVVFSPLVKPEATRWLIVPSLAALAADLVAIPFVTGYFALALTVALVAASAGILSPIVTYWISLGDKESQGAALGLQTAAASFGQALGSAAGGLLFDSVILPGASFTIPAAAVLAVLAGAFSLPKLLRPLTAGHAVAAAASSRSDVSKWDKRSL